MVQECFFLYWHLKVLTLENLNKTNQLWDELHDDKLRFEAKSTVKKQKKRQECLLLYEWNKHEALHITYLDKKWLWICAICKTYQCSAEIIIIFDYFYFLFINIGQYSILISFIVTFILPFYLLTLAVNLWRHLII